MSAVGRMKWAFSMQVNLCVSEKWHCVKNSLFVLARLNPLIYMLINSIEVGWGPADAETGLFVKTTHKRQLST